MVRRWKGKLVLGVLGASCLMGSSAHADRVLTDFEARKLTFSALIAPPARYHRVSHLQVARAQRVHGVHSLPMRLASAKSGHHMMTVRSVAYRGHVVSPHRRNTHHRRG